MKNRLYFIAFIPLFLAFIAVSSVFAADSTESGKSASDSGLLEKIKQIEILKDKIATKVAEIRNNEKGALYGKIKSIKDSTIILTTRTGDVSVTYSDDTVFYALSGTTRTTTTGKKLKEADSVSVLGYFQDSGKLIPKYIYVSTPLLHIIGKISNVEKNNYTVTIKDAQGETIADIETYSQMFISDPKKGLIKGGFSKLQIGDVIHLFGTPNAKEENKVSARRLTTISFGASATTPSPISSPSAVPTT